MIGLPEETHDDVMQTIQLMADALPGRFRWTYFYPFPGTEAYDIAESSGCIDRNKFENMVNFTDESCLDFGDRHNLFLEKVGKIFPWFVNACSQLEVAPFYREQVDSLLALDRDQWQLVKDQLLGKDKEYSARFAAEGLRHYAVKYNRFMGVVSDYFLND
jgi:radical SAM superfamily enzyme YgiQ (UPF0313 family)